MRISPRLWVVASLVVTTGPMGAVARAQPLVAPASTGAGSAVTFSRDVAPIIFGRCAVCHRPGEIGPFSLLTYDDARQHARQIAEVTARRVMPPWKPDPGVGDFLDARVLSTAEIDTIARWVADGAPEGDRRDLPPTPDWHDGWPLGPPDLVLTMKEPYSLAAGGPDVFRTFVLPIPTTSTHFVRAMVFRPGNARVVHHANLGIDRTRASRRLDEQDAEPGHPGSMAQEAAYPPGYLLGWTPGQQARPSPDGMAWRLDVDSDLVAGLHLQPSGKPESVAVSVGFYFTDAAPARVPVGLRMGSETIDIPAGERAYVINDRYTLPVDADLLAIQPHAHDLGRRMEASATLPDKTVVRLLSISDWNFRWQDVYRYRQPVPLPRGSTITMRYVYDNSAENVRNPSHPPRRVAWGQNTTDEMGDLWLQLVPRDRTDLDRLASDVTRKARDEDLQAYTGLLRADPNSPLRHDAVALLYLQGGDATQAVAHYQASIRLAPDVAATHYNLGLALVAARRVDGAIAAFRRAVELDPQHAEAHNNLGALLHLTGHADEAVQHYRRALALRPDNAEAHDNLGRLLSTRGALREAVDEFRAALSLRPDWASPMTGLAWILAVSSDPETGDVAQALRLAEAAVALTNRADPSALDALAAAYAASGQFDQAVDTAVAAERIAETRLPTLAPDIRQRLALYRARRPFKIGA